MRIGYSYLRYSSPQQGDGDSIRRQTAAAEAWCERNKVRLDTSTTFEDRGRSAFRGKHRQTGVLAQFLAEVEAGRIPKGSALIIENLDRLSRENPWDAVPLLCQLVNAGISVVTLSPSEMIYQRGRDLTGLVLAVVEFGRGHSESASKSDRLSAVWSQKKKQARESGAIVTRRLPAWVQERGGKLVPVPDRAAVVRRIFRMAVEGFGLSRIVRKLTDDGVPCWGRGRSWSKAYVHKIVSGRAVLGEYQPIGAGKPDGPPIPDYYPQVIDEGTWHRAQAALANRRDKPGRVGHKVASLFSGLLWDARTRGRMLIAWSTRGVKGQRSRKRVLVSADAMEGRSPTVSFPNDVFEAAVLSLLKEVKLADVFGRDVEGESTKLAGEYAAVEGRMRAIEAEMDGDGDFPALVRKLKEYDRQRMELAGKLAEAKQREANPHGAALAEAQSLITVAQDEQGRLRLRGLLRNILESAWVLVVPRRSHRLAAVQLHFAGGARRDYLIHYAAAGRGREGGWEARSVRWERSGRGKARELDLRDHSHATALAGQLESADLGEL